MARTRVEEELLSAKALSGIELLVWPTLGPESPSVGESFGAVTRLAEGIGPAAETVDARVRDSDAEWLLFWDPRQPDPDPEVLSSLVVGRADAWHSGLIAGTGGLPEEHDYIHPTWPLTVDPDRSTEAASWRLTLGALLVRRSVLAALGGLDRAFEGATGAGLELGRRLIDRGAIIEYTPRLAPSVPRIDPLTERDRFVFLAREFSSKWVRYAAVRRGLATRRPFAVGRALREAERVCGSSPRPGGGRVYERPPVNVPSDPSVSIVLPTLGRYELLRPVLEQIRRQTVPPIEVVVTDQNDPSLRDEAVYREFDDLNLRVIFQEEKGQWLARNAAVKVCRGEWIAFIDDDSEVGEDFVEQHLEGLARYRADLSTGASLAVIGAPVPDNYSFFRVADQWDSGNGMCRRDLFERFGLFDQQFDRQRRGDAEFGLRVQLGGGLVIHNPHAVRVHLKAQEGGLRAFGSLDGFRQRGRTSPLPLPSVVYYLKRYHTRRQLREDILIGVVQAIIPYELKRRATPAQWARFALAELIHVPSTVRRVRASLSIAEGMAAKGPSIPRLDD
ncbi:MAG: glycosyltransferase family A protein [Microthrixaceae bacterium]